jgi:hypothetical protein
MEVQPSGVIGMLLEGVCYLSVADRRVQMPNQHPAKKSSTNELFCVVENDAANVLDLFGSLNSRILKRMMWDSLSSQARLQARTNRSVTTPDGFQVAFQSHVPVEL